MTIVKRYSRNTSPRLTKVEQQLVSKLTQPIKVEEPLMSLQILVSNGSPSAKTYRFFGANTGLPSIDDNDYMFTTGAIPVTDAPVYSIVEPNTGYLYVTNLFGDNVSVIDTSTNTVLTTIAVGSQPSYLIYNPANGYIYVGNRNSSNVSVINPATNTVVTTLAVDSDPIFLTYAPNSQKVYVSSGAGTAISAIDSNNVVNSIAIGFATNFITYNSANGYIYASGGAADNATVINTMNDTVVTTITTGDNPFISAYSPTNDCVYIINSVSGNVTVINSSNVVVATITVGTTPQYILYAEGMLYVCNFGGTTVSAIDPSNNTVSSTITVGSAPIYAAYSSESGLVYVCNRADGTVSAIDPDTETVTDTIPVGTLPVSVTYVSANGSIYTNNRNSDNVSYIVSTISATIVVNGGATTISQANQNVASNPITIDKLTIDTSLRTGLDTSISEIDSNSAGAIGTNLISLLQKFTADNSSNVNVVDVYEDDFKSPIFDGSRYLQHVIPANSTISININYRQLDMSSTLTSGAKVNKNKVKKYQHAQF